MVMSYNPAYVDICECQVGLEGMSATRGVAWASRRASQMNGAMASRQSGGDASGESRPSRAFVDGCS
jgi:hypothetical protein